MSSRSPGSHSIPKILWLPGLCAIAILVLPLAALLVRVQWSTFVSDATSEVALNALTVSLVTASIATLICLVIGVPLALILARLPERPGAFLRALVTVPLVLPPMVGGIALLFLFGRRGLLGSYLNEWFGFTLPFSPAAVVLAQTFVALPFLVLALEGVLRSRGVVYERTAATLGAGPWRTFWTVTLPIATPGLLSGIILSFARAIGEFGATALFAGNKPGSTQTMPLAIYSAFNAGSNQMGAALALSVLLLLTSICALLAVRGWRPKVVS